MTATVFCHKLQKEGEALNFPPYPGELGQRILSQISKAAWQMWIKHQTMLINEYRLSLAEQSARDFLKTEMEKFLFDNNSAPPPGFIAEK